jgi:hypothetical protein
MTMPLRIADDITHHHLQFQLRGGVGPQVLTRSVAMDHAESRTPVEGYALKIFSIAFPFANSSINLSR